MKDFDLDIRVKSVDNNSPMLATSYGGTCYTEDCGSDTCDWSGCATCGGTCGCTATCEHVATNCAN